MHIRKIAHRISDYGIANVYLAIGKVKGRIVHGYGASYSQALANALGL